MNKVVLFLALLCALSCNFVEAQDECKEQFKKFKKTWK
ncbi:hypothetical protein NPIL_466901, partial [Nephila pilipes]